MCGCPMKPDDAMMKDAVVVADIGFYGAGRPHRMTLRRLIDGNDYPPDVRMALEWLASLPPQEAADLVREKLGLPATKKRIDKRTG
jgi:hypothetical protein